MATQLHQGGHVQAVRLQGLRLGSRVRGWDLHAGVKGLPGCEMARVRAWGRPSAAASIHHALHAWHPVCRMLHAHPPSPSPPLMLLLPRQATCRGS